MLLNFVLPAGTEHKNTSTASKAEKMTSKEAKTSKETAEVLAEAAKFDEVAEAAMVEMEKGEFAAAVKLFEKALAMDKKFEGQEISSERADVAYNLGCCYAQQRSFDDARTWLRRAVLWGVEDVDPSVDAHLAPMRNLRDWTEILESFLRPTERVPAAVLVRSRRQHAGKNMDALKKLIGDDDDDDDDGGSFDEDEAKDDERDVYDSDFDESEDDDEEEENESKKKKKTTTTKAPQKSKRAAARAAREVNAAEVARQDDSDDSDDDFEDAAADMEMDAQRDTFKEVTAAAEAEKRKRKVAAAFADINDDDDLKPPAPKKPKKQDFYSTQMMMRPPTAVEVLSEIFGEDAALKILAKARRARRERKSQPMMSAREAVKQAITQRQVVETRSFAGEKIQITRVQEGADAPATKSSGIDAVIDELKGPKTVTAVAKSAYDWDNFKQQHGLEDSLRDASKQGYLANQDFLNRVDHRQFEQERDERERLRNEALAAQGQQGQPPPPSS